MLGYAAPFGRSVCGLAHLERRRVGEEVCVALPLVRVRIIGPIFEHHGVFSCVQGDSLAAASEAALILDKPLVARRALLEHNGAA